MLQDIIEDMDDEDEDEGGETQTLLPGGRRKSVAFNLKRKMSRRVSMLPPPTSRCLYGCNICSQQEVVRYTPYESLSLANQDGRKLMITTHDH